MKHIILFTILLIATNIGAQTETTRPNHMTFKVQKTQIQNEIVIEDENGEPVFVVVEEMPEYPGGEKALRTFIGQNLKYPVMAQERGIQGSVYVSFVITTEGKVTQAKIARAVNPELDKEALRVIKTMPQWTPGKQRGKPVAVAYTLPINFILE